MWEVCRTDKRVSWSRGALKPMGEGETHETREEKHVEKIFQSSKSKNGERSQTQKPHSVWLHSYEISRVGKSTKTERLF